MQYNTAHIIYFSPTHTSQKIARAIGSGLELDNNEETDLTCDLGVMPIEVRNAVAVIAVPVYAGRVAPVALQRIKRLRGVNSPAIVVTVYGNRHYEDALVELRDILKENGFTPFSAGAFIGEHSYSRKNMPIAEGRPDDKDINIARNFGMDSMDKLKGIKDINEDYTFFVKGNTPYKEVSPPTPAAPVTDDTLCIFCGECIEHCPTNAVFANRKGIIDTDINECIKCCACVKDCPTGARTFDTPYTAMLHENFSSRREPELFI